jgi:hypothetical protein
MGDGQASPLTQAWIDRLDASFDAFQPRTLKQQNADASWTTLMSQRSDGRRGRLQEAEPLIPGLVWILLVVGSLLVVAFVTLFSDRRERRFAQAMLMVSVTTMLAAGLLMIKFLDDPYSDAPGSIKPDAMRRTLVTLPDLPSERTPRLPCDTRGRTLSLDP